MYQIENTQMFNSINTQERRENDDLVDTDTELEYDTVHDTEELENNTNKNITNFISEAKQDVEVLGETIGFDADEEADTEI